MTTMRAALTETASGLLVPTSQAEADPLRPSPASRRRQATIVARDPATRTCSINLAGDTTKLDGYTCLPSYVPRVGDTVWVDQLGTDYLVIGGQGTELPKAKMKTTGTQSAGALAKFTQFGGGAGGTVVYDTDFDGTNTMASQTNDRITIRWPGKYIVGFKTWVQSNGNLERKITEIQLNGTRVGRFEVKTDTDLGGTWTDEFLLANGDFFELFIASITANATFGLNDDLGMAIWASYQP